MKRKLAITLMVLGMLCVIGAGGLLLWNQHVEQQAAQMALDTAQSLISHIESAVQEAQASGETEPPAPWADEPEEGARDAVVEIDGNLYIGVLSIPALNLSLPVMSQWDYDKLRIAPCRYTGSLVEGSLIVAAHNYRQHFGSISKLLVGDSVVMVDAEGNTHSFAVAAIETINSTDIPGMLNNDYDLTLFTCTYGRQARIAVRCVYA